MNDAQAPRKFRLDPTIRLSDLIGLILLISALAGFWASINGWMVKEDYRIGATEAAVQELKTVQVQSNEILDQLRVQNARIDQIFCDMNGNCPDGEYEPYTKGARK